MSPRPLDFVFCPLSSSVSDILDDPKEKILASKAAELLEVKKEGR
jgi:hypothetical protein